MDKSAMNQQEIDQLWLRYADGADENIPHACMTKEDFGQAAAEIRRHALDEAAKLIRNAAQRAVDKEYHKTFALLLMLAGDIDKLKETTEQASQYKAICDCGDSIEPETGAICGNCASETQGNLERIIEAKQASQPQADKYREALEFIADNADMRGEALASIAGEALNGN